MLETVRRKVWTTERKLFGNAVPALVSVPFAVGGGLLYARTGQLSAWSFALLCAFPIFGWIGLALCGSTGNREMRAAIAHAMNKAFPELSAAPLFVGFARPAFRSVLDAHEDVGFLIIQPDRLTFFGETIRATLGRSEITAIRLRPNIHTWVGLGGWISIEGVSEGRPIRMLIEPRRHSTMLGNAMERKRLLSELQRWLSRGDASA